MRKTEKVPHFSDESRTHLHLCPAESAGLPPRIFTQQLFSGATEVLIQHDTETYRLRITRKGKLILTK